MYYFEIINSKLSEMSAQVYTLQLQEKLGFYI